MNATGENSLEEFEDLEGKAKNPPNSPLQGGQEKGVLQRLLLGVARVGRGLKRGLDGLGWGVAWGGVAGAMLYEAIFASYFFSPFGKFFDMAGMAAATLLSIGLLGGLTAGVFGLVRRGLNWVAHSGRWVGLRSTASVLHWIVWLVPLPLVFAASGILGAMRLASWFPETPVYFFAMPGSPMSIIAIEAGLGALAGGVWAFQRNGLGKMLAVLPVIAVNAAIFGWAIWPGTDSYLIQQPVSPQVTEQGLNLPNPGQTGPFSVRACTYGSGSDLRRPEYGAAACWTTPTVNADETLYNYKPLAQSYFEWFWGFNYKQLPLNGRVWAPEGPGPFPLVLIVHGNHAMGDFSDPGYAYLGEHLASQGLIAVSIDENFLNGFFMEDKEKAELPVRAWMLLKHIEQWQAWNEDPAHPFYHRVNLDQVGVMGHSRGGETAALAAAFNRLEESPLVGFGEPFNFKFNIRAVVEIAPSEGSFKINGSQPVLEGVNYLLIQGAHDADAYMLNGIRQYGRVKIEPDSDLFKAVIYTYRNNHGQFNSGWGHADSNPSWVLNTQPLVSAKEQELEARVFIGAFLKAALQGQSEYREVFRRPWTAAAWLPRDIALSRYQDASFTLLHDFETGGFQVGNQPGVSAQAEGFQTAESETLLTREPSISQNNSALRLSWDQSGGVLSLRLSPETAKDQQAVSFLLAPADESDPPADVTVELEDSAGHTARLALGDAAPLPVLLPAQLVKNKEFAEWIGINRWFEKPAERFLQTCILPFEQFQAQPGFDPAALSAIHFRFDRSPRGAVLLDEISLVK